MGHKLLTDLKAARLASGLSRARVAERVGTEAQAIKRLENGIGSVATLLSVMSALDFRLMGLGPASSLGDQLRARRQKLGLSLGEAARRAGLSRATVDAVERGGGSVASLLELLAVVAPRVRRRAAERAYWGEGDKADRDSRFTPPDFLDAISKAFGDIDLDPCGHALSPVVARRRILLANGGDGLVDEWSGDVVFVNPPFSALQKWLRRAYDQWQAGKVKTVLCLAPVRTDSPWFHETLSEVAAVYLLQGRIRFLDPRGGAQHTPFSLMLLTLGTTKEQRDRFAVLVPGRWWAPSGL